MHKMLDLFAVSQCIPTYYSVFVACLKLIRNVLSVYQRTCLISHTSAYVGAICRSVTGPLGHIKKIPTVLRVAWPYLYLLVKP